MDEYFVAAQPKPAPPEDPSLTREDVASLDLSGLHEPFRVPRTITAIGWAGRVVLALLALGVASLPVLLIVAVFRFLDSLPF